MKRKKYLTRRELLRLSAYSGPSIFLSSILASRAHAQVGIPKKAVFILSHNGVMDQGWSIQGGNDSLTIGGNMAPLNRHANDMAVIEGLDYRHGGGHVAGSLTFLTNQPMSPNDQNDPGTRAQGASLDYDIARKLGYRGISGDNRLVTLTDTNNPWGGGSFITYEGPGQPMSATEGVRETYNQLFANYQPPSGGPQPSPIDPQAQARGKVLDFALNEYKELARILGPGERAKLDEVATRIEELEEALIGDTPNQTSGSVCSTANLTRDAEFWDSDAFRKVSSIAAEALYCGEVSVATIRMRHGPVADTPHHNWHHGEGGSNWRELHNGVTSWQAEEVATLIDNLKSKPMGDGTSLLDNTLVFWCNEIGLGGAQEHGGRNLPVMLAGSCGGAIKTNQLISLPSNRSHSQLLASISTAMGFETESFGNMSNCEPGHVAGLLT